MPASSPPPPRTLPEEYSPLPPRKPKPRPAGPLPPLWSVILTLILALGMAGCLIAGVIALGGRGVPHGNAEPVIQMVNALPSLTPAIDALFTPTATLATGGSPAQPPALSITLVGPTLIPTATITPTPVSIAVGAQVIVISQGGINVRSQPGTSSSVTGTANNNEVFVVIDGPQEVDGLRWWQIRDMTNSRTGWVAQNDGVADLIEVYLP